MVEKILFLHQIFEAEILMELHVFPYSFCYEEQPYVVGTLMPRVPQTFNYFSSVGNM